MVSTQLPALWEPFHSPIFAIMVAIILPMVVPSILGFMVFRSRVQGVYFSIITQSAHRNCEPAADRPVELNQWHQRSANQLHENAVWLCLKDPSTKVGIYLVTAVCLGVSYLLCGLL